MTGTKALFAIGLNLLLVAAVGHAAQQNDPGTGPPSTGLPPVIGPSGPGLGGGGVGGRPVPRGGRGGGRSSGGSKRTGPEPDHAFDWDRWWKLNDDRFLAARSRSRTTEAHTTDADAQLGNPGKNLVVRVTPNDLAKDIIPAIRKATKDPFFGVRRQAAIALGKLADDRRSDVYETLRAKVADADWEVRSAACLGLGLQGSLEGVPLLISVMKDAPAARQFCGIGQHPLTPRERGYAALGIACAGIEAGLEPEAVQELLTQVLASSTHPDTRVFPALALGVIHAHAAAPDLRKVAFDAAVPEVVRAHAVVALGKLGQKSVIPLLVGEGLDDKSVHVQRSAVIALGLLTDKHDDKTVSVLIGRARSADRGVKNFTLIALGQIGNPKGRDFLAEVLVRGQLSDRTFAALGLGVHGFRVAEDRQSLGSKLLTAFRETKSHDERAAMAIALGLVDHKTAIEPIATMLREASAPEFQESFCTALGLLGDRTAIPLLQETMRTSKDGGVIMNAAMALGAIGDPAAVEILVKVFQESANAQPALLGATLALGFIGDRSAVAPLLAALESPRDYTRAYAAMALGILGDKRDVRTLAVVQENTNYLATTEWLADVLAVY